MSTLRVRIVEVLLALFCVALYASFQVGPLCGVALTLVALALLGLASHFLLNDGDTNGDN